jgi:hypothetical protein
LLFYHVNNDASYSFGVRLAHFLALMLVLLLMATGVRLTWFVGNFFSPEMSKLIDSVAPTGRIHAMHLLLGIALVAVGFFYLVYLLLSGEATRLLALFFDSRYSFTKKFLYLFTLVVGAIAFLSGVTLFSGLYVGSGGYLFMRYLHYYCFVYLLGFTVVHVIDVVVSKGVRLNAIFFARPGQRFFQAKPLMVSTILALVVTGAVYWMLQAPYTLVSREQNRSIIVDGKEYDIEWLGADSLVVQTAGGINFAGGYSQVTVKTFHNSQYIYFLVKWQDHTRSYNRFLEKTTDGWSEQTSQYIDLFGESIYFEDKLALTFHRSDGGCTATCHIRTPGRMGLHYTAGDTVDVWQWMAVSTNPAWQADDGWWEGRTDSITGGRYHDNIASGGYRSNLNEDWGQPFFLPQYSAMPAWIWIKSPDYVPYHVDIDTFSLGARIPAVLVAPAMGDRGDVTARGQWRNGVWTVEFARRLSTGSPFDAVCRSMLYLGIAPFDNAVSKHAYHLKPIRLKIE